MQPRRGAQMEAHRNTDAGTWADQTQELLILITVSLLAVVQGIWARGDHPLVFVEEARIHLPLQGSVAAAAGGGGSRKSLSFVVSDGGVSGEVMRPQEEEKEEEGQQGCRSPSSPHGYAIRKQQGKAAGEGLNICGIEKKKKKLEEERGQMGQ
ncbi:hypothetical protein HPP92_014897 [Vanilla planifolia]|uniref:Uncharacterized protein n=1 Tax=Vanilla planifolia TaxID=51239 RepID=A0A835UXC1_VANPL|nr:hypothetical protein HPP92_014897 [Vanilla planifolia]